MVAKRFNTRNLWTPVFTVFAPEDTVGPWRLAFLTYG
jgi:hypothetical protein